MSATLAGLNVVITRPRDQAVELGHLLEHQGAELLFVPLIEIVDPESWVPVHDSMYGLRRGQYSWVLFTSANAVNRYCEHLEEKGFAHYLRDASVGAVGPRTEEELAQRDIPVAKVPQVFSGESLAESIGRGSGYILLPRAAGAPKEMVELLEANGWIVDEVSAYRNVPVSEGAAIKELPAGRWDVVTFMSASAARSFVEVVDPRTLGLDQDSDASRLVACVGDKTAAGARTAGLRVDVVAHEHTAAGLVKALVEHVAATGFSSDLSEPTT